MVGREQGEREDRTWSALPPGQSAGLLWSTQVPRPGWWEEAGPQSWAGPTGRQPLWGQGGEPQQDTPSGSGVPHMLRPRWAALSAARGGSSDAQAHPGEGPPGWPQLQGPYIMQYLPGDDWQRPRLPHPYPPRPTTSQTCIKARVTYRAVRRSVLRQNYRGEEKDFYQINEKSIWPQKSISLHNVPVTG